MERTSATADAAPISGETRAAIARRTFAERFAVRAHWALSHGGSLHAL